MSEASGSLSSDVTAHDVQVLPRPSAEQRMALARHAGAARFGFNQCLALVKSAMTDRKADPITEVPWTGFDLINAFNTWKRSADAGRVFAVGLDGVAEIVATGLPWRREVRQEVFEEAAADLSKGLSAWSQCRSGSRRGKKVGFPKFKKKAGSTPSFRMRNRHRAGRMPPIRVGDNNRPRSVTLPGIGQIRVHDNTRRLRGMLNKGRAKILFATVSHRGGRWWVSLNVEAAALHLAERHQPHDPTDTRAWVGVDLGLSAYLVAATADGREIARITHAPKALTVD
ncbi:helix-turn-helix domain-containing protein [Mycolicibacterium moriokaense]|nr:helix-turn-helix domain-containing protein [Mycolicibacterium moriokaense]